jgi:mxaJ protein
MSLLYPVSAMLGALCWSLPLLATPLVICAEPDNLPFSHADGRGFEVEAATLLAKDMGQDLRVAYVTQRAPGFIRATINAGVCDAMMSLPSGFRQLAMTKAWYRSSYVMIAKPDGVHPNGLADPRMRGLRIGIPVTAGAGTPPSMALASHGLVSQMKPFSVFEPANLVRAVVTGEVDLAILWGPFAGWYVHEADARLSMLPMPERVDAVPFAFDLAIGVRKADAALLQALNEGIDRNRASLIEVVRRWHVPAP